MYVSITYMHVEHNITTDHKKTSCAHIVHVHIITRGISWRAFQYHACVVLRIWNHVYIMVFVPAFRRLGGVYSPDISDRLTTYTKSAALLYNTTRMF